MAPASSNFYGERNEAPEAYATTAYRWRCRAIIWEARQKVRDGGLRFQSCDQHTGALVSTGTECKVAVGFTRKKKLIGTFELFRIAVGRANTKRQ